VSIGSIVADLVSELSPEYCRRLVQVLSDEPNLNGITRANLTRAMANDSAALQALTALKQIHEIDAAVSAASVAVAVDTALAVAARNVRDLQVDVVWTGPSATATPSRRSAAALLELISSANEELLVLSFASFHIPDAMLAFRAAASRGVRLHFVLESAEESSGRFRGNDDGLLDFRTMPNAHAYVWPKELRPPGGLLHAKAVVADRCRALVTSANLTANAIDVNLELGLLIQSEPVAQRIAEHVFGLIDGGVLMPV